MLDKNNNNTIIILPLQNMLWPLGFGKLTLQYMYHVYTHLHVMLKMHVLLCFALTDGYIFAGHLLCV